MEEGVLEGWNAIDAEDGEGRWVYVSCAEDRKESRWGSISDSSVS